MNDRTVRYGDPGVVSDERFYVRSTPCPDRELVEGKSVQPTPYVLLRDEHTGEFWRLSKGAAHQLGVALQTLARNLKA